LAPQSLAKFAGTWCAFVFGEEDPPAKPSPINGGGGGCEVVVRRGIELCFLATFLDVLTAYAIACAALSAASLLVSSLHWPVSAHFFKNLPGGCIE